MSCTVLILPAGAETESYVGWVERSDTVVIDGRILKRGGKLVGIDVARIVREANDTAICVRAEPIASIAGSGKTIRDRRRINPVAKFERLAGAPQLRA